MNELHRLDANQIRSQISYLREICGDDDEDLLTDMIDAESNVDRFIGKMIEIIQTDQADCEGLKNYLRKLGDRKKRLEDRTTRLRTLLASVITELPGRVYRHPLAHVRAFDVDPRVIVTDESVIPSSFWVAQDPKLNETAIRKHLLERQALIDLLKECHTSGARRARLAQIDREFPDIAGASLGNGEISIRIRGA
ncbi:viral Gp157 protein [Mesorhizobium loti]|uniref:Viral Gp157 protein n=1 Tax=Rhizobium loti TaxID=381 RepID=A0A8E2WH78_RHILI|nr:siphovirus Gp157 family protein [Mesorhizobium loti]PWJ92724.1 viral Gp157 protein [Mesorhizobium loti]